MTAFLWVCFASAVLSGDSSDIYTSLVERSFAHELPERHQCGLSCWMRRETSTETNQLLWFILFPIPGDTGCIYVHLLVPIKSLRHRWRHQSVSDKIHYRSWYIYTDLSQAAQRHISLFCKSPGKMICFHIGILDLHFDLLFRRDKRPDHVVMTSCTTWFYVRYVCTTWRDIRSDVMYVVTLCTTWRHVPRDVMYHMTSYMLWRHVRRDVIYVVM